jgi:nicotinamide-nucleotide amidase
MIDRTAERVLTALRERGETLATAESLTGGLIGQLLTDVPGASLSYMGGVITYATRLKAELADVDPDTLRHHGPVSGLTAQAMASGVARRCGASWGLAVTGVAGPEPQDGHPVGQVFVAVAELGAGVGRVQELRLGGGRASIRRQTAERALLILTRALGATSSDSPTG